MSRLWRIALGMLIAAGARAGADAMEKRGRDRAGDDPEARRQAAQSSKRMRQSLRMMRRLFRF